MDGTGPFYWHCYLWGLEYYLYLYSAHKFIVNITQSHRIIPTWIRTRVWILFRFVARWPMSMSSIASDNSSLAIAEGLWLLVTVVDPPVSTFPDSSSASKFSVEAQFPSDEPCLCGNMPFISVKLFQTNITVTFSSHLSHVQLRLQAYSPIRLRKAHVTPFLLIKSPASRSRACMTFALRKIFTRYRIR